MPQVQKEGQTAHSKGPMLRLLQTSEQDQGEAMYVKKTQEEIDAANKFHTWVRGYRDGFGCLAKRKEHVEHPTLGDTYREAYDAGFVAGDEMRVAAAKRFGYEPSILRTADTANGGMPADMNTKEGEEQ